MTFGHPQFLYGLILIPAFALFLLWMSKRKQAALARLGNPALLNRLSQSVNRRGRRWQTGLWFAALALLIISLARPQWGSEVQAVEQQGIEIMVALDVSQSMLAEDIKPNRLSRARFEISDLMDRLGGDEVGLVLFAGAGFIQFPLTSDFVTARAFLDNANPGAISRPGTALAEAISTAMSGFNWQRASQKVIIIMTDGESHEGEPVEAARQAAEKGVIIYTIGFGSPQGEPIPQYNPQGEVAGYKKDHRGEVVLSKLDEITLQEIALATNGRYFRAGAAGNELPALAAELEALQKSNLESRFETHRIERFQGFLLTALLAIIVQELIPNRKKGERA
ncbi:MAG: VWA domain-containing protein [Anaerolineae bacterium]